MIQFKSLENHYWCGKCQVPKNAFEALLALLGLMGKALEEHSTARGTQHQKHQAHMFVFLLQLQFGDLWQNHEFEMTTTRTAQS